MTYLTLIAIRIHLKNYNNNNKTSNNCTKKKMKLNVKKIIIITVQLK